MNTTQPLFTVATITYNSSQWVKQTIDSILASSFPDFELLISDDGSTDDTWNIIQQYNDPRIRPWRNESNISEYPNRNKVLNEAKAEYILFVDGDDILYKHTLRNLSEYIADFPEADMIWGVQPANIDFAVLPYLFKPEVTIRLIYETTIPLAVIGFTETVFKVDSLKQAGGFSNKYSIGDTYIKKRMALDYSVLFVPMGFMFWRRSENQATSRVNKGYKNFIEGYLIDCEILEKFEEPQKGILLKQIKGSFIRRLIGNTLLKGKLVDFTRIWMECRLKLNDLLLVFVKYRATYKPSDVQSQPLLNNFNF